VNKPVKTFSILLVPVNMLEELEVKIQSFIALGSWAACICGSLCFAHSTMALRLILSHLCADFPNGGSRSIFRRRS
jgi:hypothetical protein